MNTYIHITYIHITYKHTCIYLYIYTHKLEERWLSAKRGRKAPGSDTGGLREWQYCSKFHAMVCRGMAYLHRRVPRRAVSLWESQVPLRERQGGNEGKHLLKRTIFSFSSLWWLILCVSRRLCLDEINIYIGEWWISKLLLWWEWASSNQFNAWIEQKKPSLLLSKSEFSCRWIWMSYTTGFLSLLPSNPDCRFWARQTPSMYEPTP